MSVRGLAGRVNVSPSFVSQIELGRAAPSVGTLYAIASELGLSLDALMNAEPAAAVEPVPTSVQPAVPDGPDGTAGWVTPVEARGELPNLQRAAHRPGIRVGNVQWERLTAKDDDLVEFLRVTYPSGSESCSPDNLQRHEGWEYGHVLSGQLDVQVAFNQGTLMAGDSINFPSTTVHRLSNPYSEECVAIWFVVGRQGRGHIREHISAALESGG
jgi:transcriptional regulator with XRE-family HTH domain